MGSAARPGRRKPQRGFSLLEAIVALVLIGSAGLALFSWINTNIQALNRIHEANAKSEASENILEFMHGINPMVAPQGKAAFGSYRIRWQAQPSTAVVDRTASLYQFALYSTRVDVEMPNGKSWFDMTLQQVGYLKVRSLPGAG